MAKDLKPSTLMLESNVKVDVQVTVDNIADLPAGEFEEQLDQLRETLQEQQSELQTQHTRLGKDLQQRSQELAVGYTSAPANALATAMGDFLGIPHTVRVEAEAVDLVKGLTRLNIVVLSAKDQDKLEGGESKSRYNMTTVENEVEIPFDAGFTALQGELVAVTASLQQVAEKLAAVQAAYPKISKLRARAKRRMTEAALRGEITTSADMLEFVSTLAPAELKKLPSPNG